jgi:hypothetical protein
MPTPSPEMFSLAWWDQLAPLVQAGMVLVTGIVAIRGLSAWRQQLIGKRRAELAEQVLVNFYAARDALKLARVRGFRSEEGESRKPVENEDEQVKMMRNTYFIPIERLMKEKAVFANLQAQRYTFGAYFGNPAITPFDTILEKHNVIFSTAEVLIRSAQYDRAHQAVAVAQDNLLDELGWGKRERPDDTDRAIDAAVLEIETLCRPVLQGKA